MAATLCPFCRFGCTVEADQSNPYRLRLAYPRGGRNDGRLCARGNAIPRYLTGRHRPFEPRVAGQVAGWDDALRQLEAGMKDRARAALALDTEVTAEEYRLALAAGWPVFSCHVGPENFHSFDLAGTDSGPAAALAQAGTSVLVGDLFGDVPVAARAVLDARFADRNHRIIAIDALRTRTAQAADRFLPANPGTEPFVLLALARLIAADSPGPPVEELAAACGVKQAVLAETAQVIQGAGPVMVVNCPAQARTELPRLARLAGQLLAQAAHGRFVSLGREGGAVPLPGVGRLLDAVKAGTVRYLLAASEDFPAGFPALRDGLKKLSGLALLTAQGPLSDNGALILPAASNLEKQGQVATVDGWQETAPLLPTLPAPTALGDLVERLAGPVKSVPVPGPVEVTRAELAEEAAGALQVRLSARARRTLPLVMLGETRAYAFRAFWQRSTPVRLNPDDLAGLKLAPGADAGLETSLGSVEVRVEASGDVPTGLAVASVEEPRLRALFEHATDKATGHAWLVPTRVRIWKKG